MEKTTNKRFALMLIASTIVIVMAVVSIAAFVTAKPVLAEEDYGIEPYFCNDRTETLVVGGETFSCKLDGNDALWPLYDSIKVTVTSKNGYSFNYILKITFYYHLGGSNPENSNVYDVDTWNGTAAGNLLVKKEGQDHSYGGKTYHKYDVIRARIDLTITYNGVTATRAYDLLYHQ